MIDKRIKEFVIIREGLEIEKDLSDVLGNNVRMTINEYNYEVDFLKKMANLAFEKCKDSTLSREEKKSGNA